MDSDEGLLTRDFINDMWMVWSTTNCIVDEEEHSDAWVEQICKAQRDLTRQEIPEAKREERERIIKYLDDEVEKLLEQGKRCMLSVNVPNIEAMALKTTANALKESLKGE